MKRLIFALAMGLVAFAANAQSKEQMIADWERAKVYTKAYLDAMPEDGYSYKPTPEMRTFAAQMLHLADGNYGIVGFAAGKPNPMGKVLAEKTIAQTKDATTKAVMDNYDWVINIIQNMTPAQLEQKVKMGGKDLPRWVLIGKAFEHQTHTRAQTVAYLRLKGVKPPPEMLF
ncbi:MAG TPA: DinB family protein [Mucilaginibacter sp.]|nr:DinB family protein [Mucilaginibacter sp.]